MDMQGFHISSSPARISSGVAGTDFGYRTGSVLVSLISPRSFIKMDCIPKGQLQILFLSESKLRLSSSFFHRN